MHHVCTIERRTATTGRYGSDTDGTWAAVAERVRLRLVRKAQRQAETVIAEGGIVTNDMAMFPAGTDVREGDRLVAIAAEDDPAARSPDVQIAAVLPRRARAQRHVTVLLTKYGS